MDGSALRLPDPAPFRRLVGVGGIGTGIFLAVEGDRTIGRTESRSAALMQVRDYCKLHTVAHHVSVLLGAAPSGDPFHVVPVGAVGDDEAGARLTREMAEVGMDVGRVRAVSGPPTLFSVCFQYPDGDGGNITTADSAAAALSEGDVDAASELLGPGSIALAQPEVPIARRRRLLQLAGRGGALRAASFTSSELDQARSEGLFGMVDLVALNQEEASRIAGVDLDRSDPGGFLRRCASAFGRDGGSVRVVVTAGSSGAFAIEDERWGHRPAPRVEVASTAGCGDALLAGVLAALAAGAPLIGGASEPQVDDALGLGVLLASLNATSPHTIHPAADRRTLVRFARDHGVGFEGALRVALDPEEG